MVDDGTLAMRLEPNPAKFDLNTSAVIEIDAQIGILDKVGG